jgi:hypothetical protein
MTSTPVFSATNIAFWPRLVTKAAAPEEQSVGTLRAYAAVAPHSKGYTPQHHPRKYKEQQAAMTQNVLVSAYPAPYMYLNSPSQRPQQGNYISHSQLVPTFQSLNLGGIYQPQYGIPYNYTPEYNISAAESIPVSGFYPAVQGSYYPSAVSLPTSWPSLTLSALQPSSTNSARGFSTTPIYQPTTTTGFLNSLAPVTFGNNGYDQSQQGIINYPAFPLTSYNQDYAQLGLSKSKQNPHGHTKGNKQSVSMPAPVNEDETSVREPSVKARYQYSSKYSKPQRDFEDKESYTSNIPKELEDSYDSEESSESSDSADKSNYEDDENHGDSKNSFDFAENKKRPHFTPPSYDDESEESSEFPSKSCNFFKSSPSKAATSDSNSFSNEYQDSVRTDFENQFKDFPTNENFKVPDFAAESSNNKKVSDYYKKPLSANEERLRMVYSQHSKVTDSYMTPTEEKETEIPKTLHYYNYRPPEYSHGKSVDYFPDSPFKLSSEQPRTHKNSPDYRDRDAAGHHSITTTVTHMNRMYR